MQLFGFIFLRIAPIGGRLSFFALRRNSLSNTSNAANTVVKAATLEQSLIVSLFPM